MGLAGGSATTPPEVFLARIEQGGLVPEFYAILRGTCGSYVGVPTGPGCIAGDYGAAYSHGGGTSGVPQQVFFTNNLGEGLFEVTGPPGASTCPPRAGTRD